MAIAALITWLITAVGGFIMLGLWLSKGGTKAGNSHFPPPLIFGHFGLAVIGLIVWIIYLATDTDAWAWIAFILLIPVALLGFTMLLRWIPTHQAQSGAAASGVGAAPVAGAEPAEKHFPVGVVVGHGLFAVVTVVLVFLTAVGVGGS
jgi:hypothetical protein